MSGPPASLPADIAALMSTTVVWERFTGRDGAGQPTYAPPVTLKCWQEEYSVMTGGLSVTRRADGAVVEPQWHLYFSGDDPNARKIGVYDRFTTTAVGQDTTQKLQPLRVNTMLGPNFDNKNPWMIEVAL